MFARWSFKLQAPSTFKEHIQGRLASLTWIPTPFVTAMRYLGDLARRKQTANAWRLVREQVAADKQDWLRVGHRTCVT